MTYYLLDGGEDKDMPALLCNIDGSIYGCFAVRAARHTEALARQSFRALRLFLGLDTAA